MSDVKKAKVIFLEGRHSEAAALFSELARDGDAEAAFDYAFCLEFGLGVAEDQSAAASFYRFAVEIIPEASYNLAVMHLHGTGVPRDYRRAYSYMRDAARAGVIEAQLYLGVAHTMGSMFEPDVIAISLIPCHTPIGRDPSLMLDGDITDPEADEEMRIAAVRQDLNAAHEWFRTASRHDGTYVEALAAQAKYLYALVFVDGVGTDFNRQRAEDLMLVAAEEGSPDALRFLEERAPYRLSELKRPEALATIREREGLPERT